MKKLLLLIIPILLFITTVNINVKADSDSDGWYTPDLQEYTFNIPYDSEDLIFRSTGAKTGQFVAYVDREFDFGISQNSNGALNFIDIENTLNWVGSESIKDTGYGLTPMIYGLPSYINYNIYSTYIPLVYMGVLDIHVINYRLDFMGNYSMLLDDTMYDIVYSLEIKYEINIDYLENFYDLFKGYTIHWVDTSDMQEYTLYKEMDSNLIQFQLKKIEDSESGYDAGYDDGYDVGYDEGQSEGYQDGFIAGEKSKIAKNNESFYNNIAIWIPAVITVVALASIISFFGIKKKE